MSSPCGCLVGVRGGAGLRQAAVFEHRLLVAKTSEQAEVGRVSRAWIGSLHIRERHQAGGTMARQSERARDRVQNRSPQLDASPSSQLGFLLLTSLTRSLAAMCSADTGYSRF